ncbi:MAG: oxidoreductase, partial [Betaproteobacteria bacterium]
DDLHCYRAIQEGLAASGNEWVNLHRNFDPAELGARELTANGTSDISMRNQFRAWREFMTA